MHVTSQGFGRFSGGDPDGFAGIHIDKCGGYLAPVTEFQGPLAQAASSDDSDRVGSAAIDFDKGYEALAIFSSGIIDAKFLQTEHRETHAEHLPGTNVPMGLLSIAEIIVEGLQVEL